MKISLCSSQVRLTYNITFVVLQLVLVFLIQTLLNGIFQQTNTRPHTVNVTRRYLEQMLIITITGAISNRTRLGRRMSLLSGSPQNFDDRGHLEMERNTLGECRPSVRKSKYVQCVMWRCYYSLFLGNY